MIVINKTSQFGWNKQDRFTDFTLGQILRRTDSYQSWRYGNWECQKLTNHLHSLYTFKVASTCYPIFCGTKLTTARFCYPFFLQLFDLSTIVFNIVTYFRGNLVRPISANNRMWRWQILTGILLIPSADLHNKTAPHKSISDPSIKTLHSSSTCK